MWSSLHTVVTTLKRSLKRIQDKRFKPNCDVRDAVEMRLGHNLSNLLFLAELLNFLGSRAGPVSQEAGHAPAPGLTLGQLGQLPRPELVRVDQDGGDGHQEAVSHVEDAENLDEDVSDNPEDKSYGGLTSETRAQTMLSHQSSKARKTVPRT